MKFPSVLIILCLLIAPGFSLAQQISPNPNPAGNTITVSTSNGVNAFSFLNAGTIAVTESGVLVNSGSLTNNGILNNLGSLVNNGSLTTHDFFTNNGVVQNNASFANFGRFDGEGTFIGQLDDLGVLAPGYSVGGMAVEGTLNKIGGSTEIDLGGLFDGGGEASLSQFDWIDVAGNVNLSGALEVSLDGNFLLTDNMSFDILRVSGSLNGRYEGLGEGALVGNFEGQDLFITYLGGDGNDVTLFTAFRAAVPEPTTLLVWSMLAGLGLTLRRRG